MSLDQERRHLQTNEPDLYAYIVAFEAIKVLEAIDASSPLTIRQMVERLRGTYKKRAQVLEAK